MFKVGDIVKRVSDPLNFAAVSNTPIGEARRVAHTDGRNFWVEGGGSPGNVGGCDPRAFTLVAEAAAPQPTGERDPSGLDAHAPGAKLDAGKLRPALVLSAFANALEAVIEVGTEGAAKYSDNGWLQVPNGFARYDDAARRHTLKRDKGETHDADSGSLHLAHEAWNALARLELYLREQEKANT